MALTRRDFLARVAGSWAALNVAASRAERKLLRLNARIVVVGGGYGGITAARYLKLAEPDLPVTVIHEDAEYRSCPGANEVIAGIRPASTLARTYQHLHKRYAVHFVHGEVARLDPRRGTATLRDGSSYRFDRAVVSPGIGFRWGEWQGYDEKASLQCPHAWQAGTQTELLRRQLESLPTGGVVIIVAPPNPYRCPPGPYERASLCAYHLKRRNPRAKILILDAKSQFSKQGLFLQGWNELYPGMIEWIPASTEGNIERIDAVRRIVYAEFGDHRADLLNVIPPQKAGAIAEAAGLTDRSGWCPVDPRTFASTLAPNVHVIGDACVASPMPKSAFAANSQAKVAAAAIVASLRGQPPGLPSLINHCYSFLAPDDAISVTGIYEYSGREGGLIATATGETPPGADRKIEAQQARAWQRNFRLDVFGGV